MNVKKERRFSDCTAIPAQDIAEGTPLAEAEIAFGKDVLREWVRTARHWMPDRDVKAILIEASENYTLHE